MDHVHADALGAELDEGVGQGLHGAVHITLDDDVEFLEVAYADAAADLLEGHVLLGLDTLDADELLALCSDALGLLLVGHHVEFLTCGGSAVQAEDGHRRGRTCLHHALTTLVEHAAHAAEVAAAQHDIALMQGSVLHEDGGQVAAALVQRRLDDGAGSEPFGICLEVKEVRLEQHLFEELIHVDAVLGGNLLALILTSPGLGEDVHLGELLVDLVGGCPGLIYLIDSEHHRHACGLRMVDGLNRLRHHGVVSRDDDDGEVGHLGTAGTHGREGFVTRGIKEGDMTAVFQLHVVRADVLGDSTRLTGDDVGLADVVQQGGLTVVDVTHDGNDRRTGDEVFLLVCLLSGLDLVCQFSTHEFNFVAELFSYQHEGFGVETLVDGHHQAKAHARSDNVVHRGVVHEGGEVVHRYELGDLQHFAFGGCLLALFLAALGGKLAFLLTVLRAEVVLLALVHLGVGLFDLLLDLFLHLFQLGLGHGGLEAVALATLAAGLLGCGLVVFLGAALDVRTGLRHIHLLGALGDALALLGRFLVELGQVYLAHHLKTIIGLGRRGRFGLDGFGFRFGGGLGFRFGFDNRLRLGCRCGFDNRFRFRLRFGYRFGFGNGLRFRLGLRNRLRFRLRLRLLAGKGVGANDHTLLFLLLYHILLLLPGILQDIRHLDGPLISLLRSFQVCPELLLDSGHVLVGDLCIRVLLNVRALGLEKVNDVLQSDVELPHYFVQSDFCHILTPVFLISLQILRKGCCARLPRSPCRDRPSWRGLQDRWRERCGRCRIRCS